MGKVTEISTIMTDFPGSDSSTFYDQSYGIGNNLGTLIRVITGFKLK